MLQRIARLLNEPVMGFFALLALAFAVVPMAFDLTPEAAAAFDLLDWPIVAIFALEYGAKLALAPVKRAFVLDPWHLLDLFIVVAPFLALLPRASGALRSSPVLRLLRVARAAVLGVRTGGAMKRPRRSARPEAERIPMEIHGLSAARPDAIELLDWDRFLAGFADPDDDWFHISGVHPEDFPRLAEGIEVPVVLLNSKLAETSHAKIDLFAGYSTLFFWVPHLVAGSNAVEVERTGMLLIGREQNLVTLSRGRSGLLREVMDLLPSLNLDAPYFVRVIFALFRRLIQRHGAVVDRLEGEVQRIEAQPAGETSPGFLEETFRLKTQITAIGSDLWHLQQVIEVVAEKRVALHGFEAVHQGLFGILASEAEYMYETARNIREHLLSLIDLRLNVVSFQMNKVMRLLTLLTTLALIPTVVGGLLGMNILGAPWPVQLSHVAFGVGAGMMLCLYVFAVKGWLK